MAIQSHKSAGQRGGVRTFVAGCSFRRELGLRPKCTNSTLREQTSEATKKCADHESPKINKKNRLILQDSNTPCSPNSQIRLNKAIKSVIKGLLCARIVVVVVIFSLPSFANASIFSFVSSMFSDYAEEMTASV